MWPMLLVLYQFVSGAYIFVAMGLGSIIVLLTHFNQSLPIISQLFVSGVESYPLLAMPLFMLAGNLMSTGGSVRSLIDLFDVFFGHIRGGLIIVTVAFCTWYATMTGSGFATIAAVGTIMAPEMKKAGYSDEVIAGVVACSGQLGNIIPPSITMVIMGQLVSRSVSTLFAAGVVPGILIALGMLVVGWIMATREKNLVKKPKATWVARRNVTVTSIPAVLMPLFILGGIYSGIMTPTEAASLSCIYAVIIGLVFYRGLRRWKSVENGFIGALKSAVMVYVMIGAARPFGVVIQWSGLGQILSKWLLNLGLGSMGIIALLMFFLLLLGFFISPQTIMYVAIPVLMPALEAQGVSMIWLIILWLINTLIGFITPPVAAALYIASAVTGISPEKTFKGAIPFLAVWVLVMFLCILVPDIILWLPKIMGMNVS